MKNYISKIENNINNKIEKNQKEVKNQMKRFEENQKEVKNQMNKFEKNQKEVDKKLELIIEAVCNNDKRNMRMMKS